MAKITSAEPTLLVRDVEAAANYYRDMLGFSYDHLYGDPPDFCLVYRDGISIMLCAVPGSKEIVPNCKIAEGMWNVHFWVDDVDLIYSEFVERNAIIDKALGRTEYGVKGFEVLDLDGHKLAFGQNG